MINNETNPPNTYLPYEVQIVKKVQETSTIFTLYLQFTNAQAQKNYQVLPGQFNMLYLYEFGEIPISVAFYDKELDAYAHTIQAVGEVTEELAELEQGCYLGLRGPYGNSWQDISCKTKEVVIVSGGIGNAPVVSMIENLIDNKEFAKLTILQGIRSPQMMLFEEKYQKWSKQNNVTVEISADTIDKNQNWQYKQGLVTKLITQLSNVNTDNCVCLVCGPQNMMQASANTLTTIGVKPQNIYLSLERNMQCGVGHCGHCQCGEKFVCLDGPIFSWDLIAKNNIMAL